MKWLVFKHPMLLNIVMPQCKLDLHFLEILFAKICMLNFNHSLELELWFGFNFQWLLQSLDNSLSYIIYLFSLFHE